MAKKLTQHCAQDELERVLCEYRSPARERNIILVDETMQEAIDNNTQHGAETGNRPDNLHMLLAKKMLLLGPKLLGPSNEVADNGSKEVVDNVSKEVVDNGPKEVADNGPKEAEANADNGPNDATMPKKTLGT